LPYEKQNYEAGVDEAAVKKLTGQAMVPVLIADDKVIPDSSAILDWLEATRPEPALLPKSAKDRAMATLWEEVALNALGVKRVKVLLHQPLLGGLAGVDGATPRLRLTAFHRACPLRMP
jgi:glutathione S-transferase